MPDTEAIGVFLRVFAEYGVLAIGWVAWWMERRRNAQLTDRIIAYLTRQHIVEGAIGE